MQRGSPILSNLMHPGRASSNGPPPGFAFIDAAVERIVQVLGCARGTAWFELRIACRDGRISTQRSRGWQVYATIPRGDYETVDIDLVAKPPTIRIGSIGGGKRAHLHRVLLNAADFAGWLQERSGSKSTTDGNANATAESEERVQANAINIPSSMQTDATSLAAEEADGPTLMGIVASDTAARRNTKVFTGEDEDEEALANRADPPSILEAVDEFGPSRSITRTWRFGDLCDIWAKVSGRDRREILEQFAQGFFDGAFERHGHTETLAEAENERIASRFPRPIGVKALLPQMSAAFRQEGLTRKKAAALSVRDWERMGEHGRLVLRLIEGLRLMQPAFHRWYQTAHLKEKPPIWPPYPSDEAVPEQGAQIRQVAASPTVVAGPSRHTTRAPAKVRRGRRAKYDWPHVMIRLRAKLEEDGCPRPGDGEQARLEKWVANQFHPDCCPGESIIRARVAQAIASYRASLGIEAGK
jgi:hypothetical protein